MPHAGDAAVDALVGDGRADVDAARRHGPLDLRALRNGRRPLRDEPPFDPLGIAVLLVWSSVGATLSTSSRWAGLNIGLAALRGPFGPGLSLCLSLFVLLFEVFPVCLCVLSSSPQTQTCSCPPKVDSFHTYRSCSV